MSLKEKCKFFIKNLLNLGPIMKNDAKAIKYKSTMVLKVIIGDKVDIAMFLLAVTVSTLDFITNWDLTGGLALLTLYISGLLIRLALLKLDSTNKK